MHKSYYKREHSDRQKITSNLFAFLQDFEKIFVDGQKFKFSGQLKKTGLEPGSDNLGSARFSVKEEN